VTNQSSSSGLDFDPSPYGIPIHTPSNQIQNEVIPPGRPMLSIVSQEFDGLLEFADGEIHVAVIVEISDSHSSPGVYLSKEFAGRFPDREESFAVAVFK
jgi:hypothetical protein